MTISYKQSGGARQVGVNGQRVISAINASTGVVTVTPAAIGTAPQVGSLMEIFSQGANLAAKANKGVYTVTAVSGATYTLRPKPINSGTGVLARLADFPEYTLGATNISSILVDSFDTGKAFIRVAGANFRTVGVHRNDRLQITGSSIAAHNGAWIIQAVISESVVLVRSPDNGELLTTEAVGTGTVRIRHGRIRVDVVDQARVTWSKIADKTTTFIRKGPYGSKFYRFGSGDITDYIQIRTIGETPGETRRLVRIEGVNQVSFYYSSQHDARFYSADEVVVAEQTSGIAGACVLVNVDQTLWPGTLDIRLGIQAGNRYSAGNGSAWIGVPPASAATNTKVSVNAFGSYLDGTGTNEFSPLAGNITGCVIRPKTNLGTGVAESITAYGDSAGGSGGLSVAATGDQNNLLLTKQGAQSAIASAGIIGGLLVSDRVNDPVWIGTTSGTVEFRDLRVDTDLSDLITNGAGDAIKTYLFNPRFVSRDTSGSEPSPIFYLNVTITEINETDQTESAPLKQEVTNTLGFMENGGIYLTRQTMDASDTTTNFSHRVVLQGGGFRLTNDVIQITAPITGDRAVDRIAPDYEGEFGE